MSRRTNPKRPPKSWRVLIIRRRGEYLGSVETPEIKQFDLDQDQRRRLLIQERV
jgi:hypothetical protein